MRHNKKFNHLGRTASHRSAMLANMAVSLIMHKNHYDPRQGKGLEDVCRAADHTLQGRQH